MPSISCKYGALNELLVFRLQSQMYLVFLDEGDEGGPLDLDGLSGSVVERDDEVEEVRLAQVRRRLLLEVRAADAGGDAGAEQEVVIAWSVHQGIVRTDLDGGFFLTL